MWKKMIFALAVVLILGGCGRGNKPESDKENIPAITEEAKSDPSDVASGTKHQDAASKTMGNTQLQDENASSKENTDLSAGEGGDRLTILMVGDVLLHDRVEEAARDEEGKYDFDFIFDELRDEISAADIAIVNQEVIIGGSELGVSGYPAFNAPYEIGDALVSAGFDVVCHGTNHALDKGKKGIVNAISYWKEKHPEIVVAGINADEEEYENVTIVENKGIRIAILNYTYGTNGIEAPRDMPYAVDMLDEDKVLKDLSFAEENADFTIVCPHWGTEYRLDSDSYQEKWNGIFREGGADLILGTHPHVIEPIEMAEDEAPGIANNHGGGDMLTYYSLGNFVNWTSGSGAGTANRMVGGMAKVTLKRDESNEVAIWDYGVEAVVCHLKAGHEGVSVYPLSSYTDELGDKNEIRKQDNTFSASYCRELCDKVWGVGFWQ